MADGSACDECEGDSDVRTVLHRIEQRQLLHDERFMRLEQRLGMAGEEQPRPLALAAGSAVTRKVAAAIGSLSAGAVLALAELIRQWMGGQ